MEKPSATSRWRQLEKRRKIKVWKAAEVVWRKALKLSIRAKCSGKDFTCRLQWNSLEHVWGGESLDRTPEEELWHAAGPRLALSSPPNCTYCILVIVGGGTGLLKRNPHSAYWWLLYFMTVLNELNPRLGWKSFQRRSRCFCHISLLTSHFSQQKVIPVFRHWCGVLTLPFAAVTKV